MMRNDPQIFALDLANEPAFVFAAANAHTAEALVRSSRFVRALADFCAKRRKAWSDNAVLSTRAATEAEISLYRERADEFADAGNRVLVAHISRG